MHILSITAVRNKPAAPAYGTEPFTVTFDHEAEAYALEAEIRDEYISRRDYSSQDQLDYESGNLLSMDEIREMHWAEEDAAMNAALIGEEFDDEGRLYV